LPGKWTTNLPTVLWSDRCSIHNPTGYAPVVLITGQNPVLSIELSMPTWQTLPYTNVKTREDLL
ncbi:hypothetical protein BU24DRAFT_336272, partial [Aaosphaeria arxii CBS 175.79]